MNAAFHGAGGPAAPEQGHFYALPIRGTPWGRGQCWANTAQPPPPGASVPVDEVSARMRSPSRPGEPRGVPPSQAGHPVSDLPPRGGKGEQDLCCRGNIWPPLPYPVFVLADLLHLKSLGTLALGHLPGDLPSPTREVRDQDFGSLPQYKALLG